MGSGAGSAASLEFSLTGASAAVAAADSAAVGTSAGECLGPVLEERPYLSGAALQEEQPLPAAHAVAIRAANDGLEVAATLASGPLPPQIANPKTEPAEAALAQVAESPQLHPEGEALQRVPTQ